TSNHLMLIYQRSKNIDCKLAKEALGNEDINDNKNMVTFDTASPMVTSGIRVGSAAITSRGLGKDECIQIVEWMDSVVRNHEDEAYLSNLKNDVKQMMSAFPLPGRAGIEA